MERLKLELHDLHMVRAAVVKEHVANTAAVGKERYQIQLELLTMQQDFIQLQRNYDTTVVERDDLLLKLDVIGQNTHADCSLT